MERELNPGDALVAAYQQADSAAAFCFEMEHRCRLTKGRTPQQVLERAHADTFNRQLDYAFHFPASSYRPPAPYFPGS